MFDGWIFVAAVIVALAWGPFVRAGRLLPRVSADPAELPDLEELQARYARRATARQFTAFAMIAALVYFVVRALTVPTDPGVDTEALTRAQVIALLGATWLGAALATLRQRVEAVKLIRKLPEYADCLESPWYSISVLGALFLAFACVIGAIAVGDGMLSPLLFLVAMVIFLATFRLARRAALRRDLPLPEESSLARELGEVMTKFGFEPKRIALIRSLITNALAHPDGTVGVTSMMCRVMSDREIAAVLAHELSHVRDRDAKRLQRAATASMVCVLSAAAGLIWLLAVWGANPAYFISVGAAGLYVFALLVQVARKLTLHRMEYKCDADAAGFGYGADLVAALTKLHRVMGVPHTWLGLDALTMTHPSLSRRVAALEDRPVST